MITSKTAAAVRTIVHLALALLAISPASAQRLTAKIGNPLLKTLLVAAEIKDEGSFQLQRSDTLANWAAVTNFNAFPATTNTTVDTYTDARRFYRLFRLTVPPAITLQPQGLTNYSGTSVRLEAAATGSWPLRYQWYKDTQPVTGATSNVLTFTGTIASSGAYTLLVLSPWGNVTSQVAPVSINFPVATNIAGKKIHFEIQAAQGDFLTSGTFDTIFDPSGFYTSQGTSVFLNDSGYWRYGISSETTGVVAESASVTYGDAQFTLMFQTSTNGTYTLVASTYSGSQIGRFTLP